MSESTTITFRTDRAVKEEARELYASMGMDLSTAINVFLRQSIRDNGMPFRITNEPQASVEARRQATMHEGETFPDADALMKDLLDAE
ncbi:type II toxin-antitoxin system RelB/DinJ family antitoxin [Bifidobacterium cuniculi]|uniref:DNA-damage-inducible protein J n=1 Tax=Bifidobacterium cuniculi TaxID=1688 RepID=A0A087AWQ4_9BIFI|nr:type II toxin-antitoxin system RelB/DinJ family antitoxin [Bifidobacterium cuniculi]KFI63204.1 DNA-damage-inducible protein J [Bifidobacterium cuniculi]